MWLIQDGKCGVCQVLFTWQTSNMDHEHNVCPHHGGKEYCIMCIRAWVCNSCNQKLASVDRGKSASHLADAESFKANPPADQIRAKMGLPKLADTRKMAYESKMTAPVNPGMYEPVEIAEWIKAHIGNDGTCRSADVRNEFDIPAHVAGVLREEMTQYGIKSKLDRSARGWLFELA